VRDELRVRAASPRRDIPPELPGRALGIIGSDSWDFKQVDSTEDEDKEVRVLQERIGGLGSTGNAGECEAAVLIARRDPTAVLATDDRSALLVLARYVLNVTGQMLRYVHTSSVIEELRAADRIDDETRDAIRRRLERKKRPLL